MGSEGGTGLAGKRFEKAAARQKNSGLEKGGLERTSESEVGGGGGQGAREEGRGRGRESRPVDHVDHLDAHRDRRLAEHLLQLRRLGEDGLVQPRAQPVPRHLRQQQLPRPPHLRRVLPQLRPARQPAGRRGGVGNGAAGAGRTDTTLGGIWAAAADRAAAGAARSTRPEFRVVPRCPPQSTTLTQTPCLSTPIPLLRIPLRNEGEMKGWRRDSESAAASGPVEGREGTSAGL